MSELFWAEEFDLSGLSYTQFLVFFFDRPVVGFDDQYNLFRSETDYFEAADPTIVVGHLQAMCQDFGGLAKNYSAEQLDQGLWAVFGAGISCERYLFDSSVDIDRRRQCVESVYLPFRDVVAHRTGDIGETFYWMWWDMILHTFGPSPHEYEYGYLTLTTDQQQMIDVIFRTLAKILAIGHKGCHWCALHGMGHLYHPLRRATIQNYLDVHGKELSADEVKWIEGCREANTL